jgi:hypothetical protein
MIGMKVSKPGYNVLTTSNANLSFSSQLATHSIYNVASLTIPSAGTAGTISHNLGYIPKTWIFQEIGSGTASYMRRIPVIDDTNGHIDYTIGTANITVKTLWVSSDTDYKVIIFTRSPNP